MAIEWMDGFEIGGFVHQSASRWDGFVNGNSWQTGRFGGTAIGFNSASCYKNVPAAATKIVGGAFMAWGTNDIVVQLMEGATLHIELRVVNNLVRVTRNGTLLAEGTTPISYGSAGGSTGWYGFEIKATIHDTTGSVEVRLNGQSTPEISLTNVDTRNSGTGVIDRVQIGSFGQVDDLRIIGTTGDAPTNFIGDQRIETRMPSGAGNSAQFTPSTGSNWQNVDELQAPNEDTDYNASSTAGHIDLHAMQDLVTTSGVVEAIQITHRWRKDDAGARTARRVLRSGAANYEGSDVAMTDSYTWATERLRNDPATSTQFTIAGVNALEVGYKVQA